jgi:beta-phosphoglucomutase-like phosphatase (HAD superfamily)
VKALFFDLDGTLTDVRQREIEAIYDTANHFVIVKENQGKKGTNKR